MYAIRLELGRELEDYLFQQTRALEEAREQEEHKQAYRKSWYQKRIMSIFSCLGFLLGILIFVILDISLARNLREVREEVARRPVVSAANPILDFSVKEEEERALKEEQERKEKMFSAVTTDDTEGFPAEVVSEYGIVVDIGNDTILASKNCKTRINPASMTKIMTVLVAAEAIEEAQLDEMFTVTPEINYYSYKHDCSAVGFSDNEEVTVKDLFYGTILPSGGDAALALATYIAGDQDAFVEMMNDKLEVLGLNETAHFTNCIGLYDDNHYCTAYDMAMILHAAIENPLCKEVMSARKYVTSKTTQHPDGIEISNWFLRRIEDKPVGGEVMCAKTGYVKESGNCAASYATDDDGNEYIVVTGKSTSSWRCIYDHVELYRRYFPKYDSSSVDEDAEAAQAAEEGNSESNGQ